MMCPVESPAGADAPRFLSPEVAQGVVGLEFAELRHWAAVLRERAGYELGSNFAVSDLVALAALKTAAGRLGAGADTFVVGLSHLFGALREQPDVEHLDGYAALVGRDSARIAATYDAERCAADGLLVIPLRPILASLRDQVFA